MKSRADKSNEQHVDTKIGLAALGKIQRKKCLIYAKHIFVHMRQWRIALHLKVRVSMEQSFSRRKCQTLEGIHVNGRTFRERFAKSVKTIVGRVSTLRFECSVSIGEESTMKV